MMPRIPPGFGEDEWFANGDGHDEVPDEHFWFVCDCGERFNKTDEGLAHIEECDDFEWPVPDSEEM